MYTPRKGWQRWKKVIERNIVTSENGKTIYRLGEMSWQRHCIMFRDIIDLDYEAVAAMFPISSFEREFLCSYIDGSSDPYSFDMLDRHGYNILKKRDKYHQFSYSTESRSRIIEKLLRRLNSDGTLERLEMELGLGKTNLIENMDRTFSEEEKEEIRKRNNEVYEWREDFVYDE